MTWLVFIRKYFLWFAAANLVWETAKLPHYTIWTEGNTSTIAFAALHCTGGDMLIGVVFLLGALSVCGNSKWPDERYSVIALAAIFAVAGFLIFSGIAGQHWQHITHSLNTSDMPMASGTKP